VTFSRRAGSRVEWTPQGHYVIPHNITTVAGLEGRDDPVYWRLPSLKGDMVGV